MVVVMMMTISQAQTASQGEHSGGLVNMKCLVTALSLHRRVGNVVCLGYGYHTSSGADNSAAGILQVIIIPILSFLLIVSFLVSCSIGRLCDCSCDFSGCSDDPLCCHTIGCINTAGVINRVFSITLCTCVSFSCIFYCSLPVPVPLSSGSFISSV
jgi:hypothetical protein